MGSGRRCDKIVPQIKTILKALTLPLSSLNLEQTGKSVLLQGLVLKTTVSLSLPELLADGSDIDARVKLDVYFAFKRVKKKERKKENGESEEVKAGGGGGRGRGPVALEWHKCAEVVSYAEIEQERPEEAQHRPSSKKIILGWLGLLLHTRTSTLSGDSISHPVRASVLSL